MPSRPFSGGSNRTPPISKGRVHPLPPLPRRRTASSSAFTPSSQNIFDAKYKEFLASNGLAGDPGLSVGQQVVAALLKHHRPAPEMPDTYKRFSDAAQEVVDARILLGIHFRFADEVARTQGSRVANWTFERFLRPRTDGRK